MTRSVPAAKQGEIWDAHLEPVIGHEQGGSRPVMIVSVDEISAGAGEMCIVVPFTRTERDTPLHVRIDPPEGGLSAISFALPENVRSISRERLARRRGSVRDSTLEQVLRRVHLLTRQLVTGPHGPSFAATGTPITDEDVRRTLEAARERR